MKYLADDKKISKVSIVIPCFNLGEYLEEAVKSVEDQTFMDREIIIVDDGSTDRKTEQVIKKIKSKNPDIKVIKQKNTGPAAARNNGIKHARGEYIACLDADDMLAPLYLEKTTKLLDEAPNNIGFVSTWLKEFGLRSDVWKAGDFDVAKMLITNTVHAGSLFKKSAWEKVGGYTERRDLQGYEDWDFWLKLIEFGYGWETIHEVLFLYRIRENSLLSIAKDKSTEMYKIIYQHHKSLFSKHLNEFILENARDVRQLHEAIKNKNEAIEELQESRDEAIRLREEVFSLRDEINSMKNSRVLGKVIKTREFVGSTRKKVAPRKAVHATRVKVAPFIPGPLRRTIKTQAKKVLQRQDKAKIIVQKNNKWSGSVLVSVVIPYYNRADTVDDTVASLESQTFTNFETIIVNDGSTEPESIKKLEEIKKSKFKAAIINQENAGVAAARNNGVGQASGKYIICLDSDDVLEPTYIEKATTVLETNPDASVATSYMNMFGVINKEYEHVGYDPEQIIRNNMVITAAEYKKEAWEASGGYKSGIGYEDWEFWVNLSEKGYWAKLIPETLFRYRTSMQSRYVEDKDVHWKNMKSIQRLHPQYKRNIQRLKAKRQAVKNVYDPQTALVNLDNGKLYKQFGNPKPNVLIIVPWLTFGGAETLILNFTKEIKDDFNLSFISGLESKHEWEYKFKEITDRIYHMSNLFGETDKYLEFISNYIKTRKIDAMHIIHTDYAFPMLPELKHRHPELRVIVTLFNDRAAHFAESLKVSGYIDEFSSDNKSVYDHYCRELGDAASVRIIPNAIDSNEVYNPLLYDRQKEREALGIGRKELAVFFIGRISEEKKPDVFLDVAEKICKKHRDIKFFVIGNGPMMPEVSRQMELINEPNIQYLDYKSEVASYLAAADIFVLPSSIEGFPLSILEAMAMKVAVIASDVGAVSEVIRSGSDGFVVAPSSAAEIAEAIEKLKSNSKLLEKIKRSARLSVESKYSNTILGANYRKLYRDSLK